MAVGVIVSAKGQPLALGHVKLLRTVELLDEHEKLGSISVS